MKESTEALMGFLREIKENRGAMANLRCALVERKRHRAWPLLARFQGIGDDYRALAVQHVAGLYATHPMDCTDGDFGMTCRRLLSDDEREAIESTNELGAVARRFLHLLAAENEEVFSRVLRLVLRAKAEEVPVNYSRLLEDLMQWRWNPQLVRIRWARNFWAPSSEEVA